MKIKLTPLYFLTLFCVLISTKVQAQQHYNKTPGFLKANSVWAIIEKLGLDFNDRPNFTFSSALVGHNDSSISGLYFTDGTNVDHASVADPSTGTLLFYSNGGTVWNKNHVPMPNGQGLWGNSMGTMALGGGIININTTYQYQTPQGVCIVPVVCDREKYYLFSLENFAGSAAVNNFPTGELPAQRLYYSIVDMSMDSGRGDVMSGKKNILLDSSKISGSMIAIPGENNDLWLMLHLGDTSAFKAYHITTAGIDPNPVYSYYKTSLPSSNVNTGSFPFEGSFTTSTMAVSSDKSKIALTTMGFMTARSGDTVAKVWGTSLFDFDAQTGRVSNAMLIDDLSLGKKLAFSPDGNKLYLSTYSPQIGVAQFDITVRDSTTIAASKTMVNIVNAPMSDSWNFAPSIKLYNDTIYVTNTNFGWNVTQKASLDRINKPNLKGTACDYQKEAIIFAQGEFMGTGLPNEVVLDPRPRDTSYNRVDTMVCVSGDNEALLLNVGVGDPSYTYEWNNKSTDSVLSVTEYGTYWVRYTDGCYTRIDTFVVGGFDLNPIIRVDSFDLSTTEAYASYQWFLNGEAIPNAINRIYSVTENGDYAVEVGNGICTEMSDIYKIDNVTGVKGIRGLADDIHIYPNPATDMVHIKSPIKVNVQICGIEGRVIKEISDVNSVSVSELATGAYLIHIFDRQGYWLKTEKLIRSN